ncbi:hypothetical protein FQZ97_867860 [compost metagenome]
MVVPGRRRQIPIDARGREKRLCPLQQARMRRLALHPDVVGIVGEGREYVDEAHVCFGVRLGKGQELLSCDVRFQLELGRKDAGHVRVQMIAATEKVHEDAELAPGRIPVVWQRQRKKRRVFQGLTGSPKGLVNVNLEPLHGRAFVPEQ